MLPIQKYYPKLRYIRLQSAQPLSCLPTAVLYKLLAKWTFNSFEVYILRPEVHQVRRVLLVRPGDHRLGDHRDRQSLQDHPGVRQGRPEGHRILAGRQDRRIRDRLGHHVGGDRLGDRRSRGRQDRQGRPGYPGEGPGGRGSHAAYRDDGGRDPWLMDKRCEEVVRCEFVRSKYEME
jgi:hypothetical protein